MMEQFILFKSIGFKWNLISWPSLYLAQRTITKPGKGKRFKVVMIYWCLYSVLEIGPVFASPMYQQ